MVQPADTLLRPIGRTSAPVPPLVPGIHRARRPRMCAWHQRCYVDATGHSLALPIDFDVPVLMRGVKRVVLNRPPLGLPLQAANPCGTC